MPDGCVEYGQDILLTWDLPIFVKMLNPNKVRLFEGSFSGVGGWGGVGGGGGSGDVRGGVDLTHPFIFQEELIWYQLTVYNC